MSDDAVSLERGVTEVKCCLDRVTPIVCCMKSRICSGFSCLGGLADGEAGFGGGGLFRC